VLNYPHPLSLFGEKKVVILVIEFQNSRIPFLEEQGGG
jgi:hypothetical protein